MVLVFISGLVFAFFAAKKARVQKQKAIAAKIEASGGEVFHTHVVERRDPSAPKWLLDRLGIDTFEGLGQIELMDTDVDDIAEEKGSGVFFGNDSRTFFLPHSGSWSHGSHSVCLWRAEQPNLRLSFQPGFVA